LSFVKVNEIHWEQSLKLFLSKIRWNRRSQATLCPWPTIASPSTMCNNKRQACREMLLQQTVKGCNFHLTL